MNVIVNKFSIPTLLQAFDTNQIDVFSLLACPPAGELTISPEIICLTTGIPHALVNGVLRTCLTAANTDTCIEETLNHFRFRQLPMMWTISPATQPTDLDSHLEAHGLILLATLPCMAVDLQVPVPTPSLASTVTIREVTDASMLADWSQAAIAGFNILPEVIHLFAALSPVLGYGEQSPLRNFVAYLDGEPVGSSTVYLHAGVAGIYCVSVIPKARRYGIGAALTRIPLKVAQRLGYRFGMLLSSEMGVPIYRRLGFEEYGQFVRYGWQP